jgi:hypothetical protein
VESEPGKGSAFTVQLPVGAEKADGTAPTEVPAAPRG